MNQTNNNEQTQSKTVFSTYSSTNQNHGSSTNQTRSQTHAAGSQHTIGGTGYPMGKTSSNHTSTGHSINGGGPQSAFLSQISQHNGYSSNNAAAKRQSNSHQPPSTTSKRGVKPLEEEKTVIAPQVSQQPSRPLQSYEVTPLEHRNLSAKPTKAVLQQTAPRGQQERPKDGEKMLRQRHQMRLTSGDTNRKKGETPLNVTRSMIDDGSEDFTNIEERLQEDTRISCRNAVASSLNNVSQILKQQRQQNIRGRRGTTNSNGSGQIGGVTSNHVSKEETFETSSFFDEGVSRHIVQSMHQTISMQSPHKCRDMDGYSIPTIFNTLMFGIDQTKVSDKIRESFSNLSGRGRPSSQMQTHQQPRQQPASSQPVSSTKETLPEEQKANKGKLSQLVTKVENSPIMVFDNKTKQVTPSEKTSHLRLAHQQQKIEQVDSLSTEIPTTNFRQDDDCENEEEAGPGQGSDDYQSSELHRNHLIQTLQSLQYIKTLPPVNKAELRKRQVTLPLPKAPHIKKTIIFDLDETLVHCIDDIENNPCDQVINVTFPNGETVQAGINVRPYALECLRKANEQYQVVVFTASHKAYADVVLDSLDPTGTLIQHRLYRDHCIRTEEGIYVKDLRIITNRQLKDMIIVDNAVYSFGYQLDNGIPIIPFYDDKSDEELMHLIFYFNCLASCPDVREQNRKAFQLKDLQEIDIQEYLQQMTSQQQNDGYDDE